MSKEIQNLRAVKMNIADLMVKAKRDAEERESAQEAQLRVSGLYARMCTCTCMSEIITLKEMRHRLSGLNARTCM